MKELNKFIVLNRGLEIAGANVKRRFKAVTDNHLLVINTPSGLSENFIRDIAKFSEENRPTEQDI